MNESELVLRLVRGTDDYTYAFADPYLTVMDGRTGQVVRFDVERDEVAFNDEDYDSPLAILLKAEADARKVCSCPALSRSLAPAICPWSTCLESRDFLENVSTHVESPSLLLTLSGCAAGSMAALRAEV